MNAGKLYGSDNGEFVDSINYQLYDESEARWWGELILANYKQLSDIGSYIIELEDGRKGRCSLRKRVNRAVSGVPSLFHYQFIGHGPLK